MIFQEMTWPALRQVDREQTILLFPVAAVEQHGPHLPTFTDSLVAGAISAGVEQRLPHNVLLLPVMWLGASEHHLPFGATLTARVETHITLLTEIIRPLLADGYRRLLVLNAHGGNSETIRIALRRLQREFPNVLLTGAGHWELAEREIAPLCESSQTCPLHACEVETSMVLALRPDLVQDVELDDHPQQQHEQLHGLYISQDMAQATPDGFLGLPTYGTAEKGRQSLQVIEERVVEVCRGILNRPLPEERIVTDVPESSRQQL